jgi:UDP-2,4-diacetamido-2,4,6-trideoxy-beta-L-altropyranose hydrolase
MNVIFRVDASVHIGTGHVMRCLTLAKSLKDRGAEVNFICRKHDGNLIDKIIIEGFNVFELECLSEKKVETKQSYSYFLGVTQEQDAIDCKYILQLIKVDLLIVDHYALDEEWHQCLNGHYSQLMVIDDLADRKFQCNILLNQNLGATLEEYKDRLPNKCQLLIGCDYGLLRPEFLQLRARALYKRKYTNSIDSILISMGGSDFENITFDVIKNINNSLEIVVILGASSPHIDMIRNYAVDKNITVLTDVDNMADLMVDADLAIGAGGSTSWERCCLGLPTLLYVTADNQKDVAVNLEKNGAVKIVKNLKKDIEYFMKDIKAWRNMSNNACKVSDGLGVTRVVEKIFSICTRKKNVI